MLASFREKQKIGANDVLVLDQVIGTTKHQLTVKIPDGCVYLGLQKIGRTNDNIFFPKFAIAGKTNFNPETWNRTEDAVLPNAGQAVYISSATLLAGEACGAPVQLPAGTKVVFYSRTGCVKPSEVALGAPTFCTAGPHASLAAVRRSIASPHSGSSSVITTVTTVVTKPDEHIAVDPHTLVSTTSVTGPVSSSNIVADTDVYGGTVFGTSRCPVGDVLNVDVAGGGTAETMSQLLCTAVGVVQNAVLAGQGPATTIERKKIISRMLKLASTLSHVSEEWLEENVPAVAYPAAVDVDGAQSQGKSQATLQQRDLISNDSGGKGGGMQLQRPKVR